MQKVKRCSYVEVISFTYLKCWEVDKAWNERRLLQFINLCNRLLLAFYWDPCKFPPHLLAAETPAHFLPHSYWDPWKCPLHAPCLLPPKTPRALQISWAANFLGCKFPLQPPCDKNCESAKHPWHHNFVNAWGGGLCYNMLIDFSRYLAHTHIQATCMSPTDKRKLTFLP